MKNYISQKICLTWANLTYLTLQWKKKIKQNSKKNAYMYLELAWITAVNINVSGRVG